MKRILAFICLILFVVFFSACSQRQAPKSAIKNSSIFKAAEVKQVLVKEANVNIYAGGSTFHAIVSTVNKGDILRVSENRDGWYMVVLRDGQEGFIEKEKVIPYVENVDIEENIIIEDDLLPDEKKMLNLVNAERLRAGLNPLKLDLNLSKLARLKSKDLIDHNYFNHFSPTLGSPFDMMEKHKINYIFAGENLAGNKDVKGAHFSLMESTTHRQNILNPTFTHIGIGMQKGGTYGKIFTQLFIGR